MKTSCRFYLFWEQEFDVNHPIAFYISRNIFTKEECRKRFLTFEGSGIFFYGKDYFYLCVISWNICPLSCFKLKCIKN